MSKKRIAFLFLWSLLWPSSLLPVVKGSETVVSIESAVTFPADDSDNTMLGFGWFKNGFTLEDELTTCTFDSVYPVSGGIDLRGGTLHLLQDLIFKNTTHLQGWGNITGNGHVLDLCSTITSLPTNTQVFEDANILFSSDLKITSTITFKGNCVVCGLGNELILEEGGELIIDSDAILQLRDMEIIGIGDKNIQCADDTASIILDNVRWIQDDHFTFDTGSITFKDQVCFVGSYTFIYESSQTSTIESHGKWLIADNMHLCIGRDAQTNNEPLAFTDNTSTLQLDNCGFIVSSSGIQFTKGTVVFDRNVTADMQSTSTDTGVVVGTGNVSDDCIIYYSPGSVVTFNSGHFTFNNSNSQSIESASATARFVRNENSYIYVAQDLELPVITIELESNLVPPMQVESGKILSYKKSSVVLPDIQFDITSNQLNALTYLLNGNDSLFFTKGTLPLALSIQSTGNKVEGNGSMSGPIVLQDSAAALSIGLTGDVLNSVSLNNGKVTLLRDLSLRDDGIMTGPGTVDIATYIMDLPGKDLTWDGPMLWEGDGGVIEMNSNLSLSDTWTISGKCVINGNGSSLDLSSGGELLVDEGSQLVLKNIHLLGIADNNIRCLDDEASIYLVDTKWVQDADYTFTTGSMRFIRHNTMTGPYTFFYESSQTSTIRAHAELHVTGGIHLSVARDAVIGNEPLEFTNDTAVLLLDNCSFDVQSPGIQLTKGTVKLDRNVEADIQSTSTTDGVIVGTGQAEDDLCIYFSPSAVMTFKSGHFVYNNASPTALKSSSKTARLVRNEGSDIFVAQDIEIPAITIVIESNLVSPMQVESGKSLSYKNSAIVLPDIEFDITSNQLNALAYLLNGNDSLFFTKGTFPLGILAQSSGNLIRGNGTVTGPITLQDSGTNLSIDLTGALSNVVALNNGTLSLGGNLFLLSNCTLTGPGIVDLSTCTIDLPASVVNWSTPIQWKGNGGEVAFNNKYSLASTWTFNGNCVINGHGNTLELSTGEIVIDEASQLTLKNIRILGIDDTNIRCLDDAGIITLEDVTWIQDATYSFTTGALQFKNKNRMQGDTTFVYQSVQTSTLLAESELKLDTGFTFKYDPIFIDSRDLLEFSDQTSVLILNSASLHATVTGMDLIQGKLLIKGESNLFAETKKLDDDSTFDQGISLGDETGSGDMHCEITTGAILNVKQGSLRYKNVDADSWVMSNDQSLFHMKSGTALRLHQSLTYDQGIVRFCNNTVLARAVGKKILGSVEVTGSLLFKNLPFD